MGIRQRLQSVASSVIVGSLLAQERLTSGVAYNPAARDRSNPYPLYRRLREKDPVHRSRLVGGWVLSRYEDVIGVLRDSRFSSDDRNFFRYERDRRSLERRGVLAPDERDTPSMLRLDPPDHTRLRTLVNKAFTPRAVRRLRPRVEAIAHAQLDAVAGDGGMDVIRQLAYPLPVTVIAEMLGVPTEDLEKFKHWSDEVVRSLGIVTEDDLRASMRAGRELEEYLTKIAEERRRDPRDDLMSALIAAEEQGDKLSMAEVLSTAVLLLVAGNETTTNLIGNAILALLRHPDQLEYLRRNPERVEPAVEELLRFDSPVQSTSRMVLEDLELGGRRIRRGQQLMILLGSANRDPDQFPEPEELDLERKDAQRHLSFGHGVHHCLGAALARLEGQVAIGAVVQRFPALRLAAGVEWGDHLILRGVKSLPVTF